MKKLMVVFVVAFAFLTGHPAGAEELCRVVSEVAACKEEVQLLAELQYPEIVCERRETRGSLYLSGVEEVACSEGVANKSLGGIVTVFVVYVGKEVAASVIKELVIREYERRYGHVPGNVVVK